MGPCDSGEDAGDNVCGLHAGEAEIEALMARYGHRRDLEIRTSDRRG